MSNNKGINIVESRARELFESLFNDSKKVPNPPTDLVGNIDGLSNRTLSGWAANKSHAESAVRVSVYSGEEILGTGIADLYREDLKKAGIGNGNHGFQVLLDPGKLARTNEKLTLVDCETGERIDANPYSLEGRADFVAEVTGIVDRRVVAEITRVAGTVDNLSVEILVDGSSRLPCAQVEHSRERTTVEALLPDDVFDGLPHTYEVIANNANCISSVHIEVSYAVTTPEEFLVDSLFAEQRYRGHCWLDRQCA